VYHLGAVTVNALDGVDLAVARGEFVAIMGPSGSGKSTLLHLLGGLDRPDGGSVRLAGQALETLDDDALTLVRRRGVGFIFQFFNLVPTLTAEENVALPLVIDGQDVAAYAERIGQLISLVGLSGRRDHRPDQLSGGEQQRVAIARAFVTEPAIVMADEPTGNLDSRTGREVLALLRRGADELGQTLVMVTHDPAAAAWTDRVLFLRDGRLVDTLANPLGPGAEAAGAIMDRLHALESVE
jgi:putative ABC transport system ATP-binding protein